MKVFEVVREETYGDLYAYDEDGTGVYEYNPPKSSSLGLFLSKDKAVLAASAAKDAALVAWDGNKFSIKENELSFEVTCRQCRHIYEFSILEREVVE